MNRSYFASTIALAVATGCGDDVSGDPAGSGASAGSGGGAGEGGSPDTGGSGGSGGGCQADADCDDMEFCVWADGLCGDGAPKSCVFLAPTCPESPAQNFCDCSGAHHAGQCVLEQDERPGACAAAAGAFWCGEASCPVASQYCALANDAACTPLPPECQAAGADCSCFGELSGGCQCAKEADGHFEVVCQPEI
jgi:hypothetical protein